MKRSAVIVFSFVLAFVPGAVRAGPPSILSLQTNGVLTWINGMTNRIAVIQRNTNLNAGAWSPFYYDSGGYSRTSFYPSPYYQDVVMPSLRTTPLPLPIGPSGFLRLGIQTNPPDPTLLMHLSFDNDFTNTGVVLDISGHGNDGLRYGRPGYPTNWPSATIGPDGSRGLWTIGRLHRDTLHFRLYQFAANDHGILVPLLRRSGRMQL